MLPIFDKNIDFKKNSQGFSVSIYINIFQKCYLGARIVFLWLYYLFFMRVNLISPQSNFYKIYFVKLQAKSLD